LFKKNHYPFLKKLIESGRIVQVTADSPIYHTTEEGRWDYRVRIIWKNVQAALDNSGEEQILKQLYPDRETFKREEQRRFEILLAHWDLPIKNVNLEEK
jgi:nitric oxide reductase activation protein